MQLVELDFHQRHVCRVYSRRVAHLYRQAAVFQSHVVQGEHLFVKIKALWRGMEGQFIDVALDAHVADELACVEFGLMQFHLVQLYLAAQQRAQLHVGYQSSDVGYGVAFLYDEHPVGSDVQREPYVHMFYGNLHARLFRGIESQLLDSPVLDGGDVKQDDQQYKQQNGAQQDYPQPLEDLSFLHVEALTMQSK